MNFTWVPFYQELVKKVLEFEDRQGELLAIDAEMRASGLLKKSASELDAIDPFTFLLRLGTGGYATDARKDCYQYLKSQWNIDSGVPQDFNGFAQVDSGALRFFHANSEQVRNLWVLAKQAQQGLEGIEPHIFQFCALHAAPKDNGNTAFHRLIAGLCWINPTEFLPELSGDYLENMGVNGPEPSDFDSYRQFLNDIRDATSIPFVEIINDSDNYLTEFDGYLESDDECEELESVDDLSITITKKKNNMRIPLNQILYGPPGTGKTYNSIQKAVEIIDGEIESQSQAKARFKELRNAGQIGFVTFHQSFSYEEFIEGLRPVIRKNSEGGEDSGGSVEYEIRDGVLKEIALKAQAELKEVPPDINFEAVWSELIRQIERGELTEINGRTSKSIHQLKVKGNRIEGENILSEKESRYFDTTKEKQEEAWHRLRYMGEVKSTEFNLTNSGRGNAPFGAVIHNKLKEIYHDLSGTSDLYRIELDEEPNKKFVLIIDEINRGNISKILGELITLLEEDKRIGAENELRLTLPTSGETFALPPNLYILGTMNTSDKSLAQLDVALRRRFSFIEMPPRLELCDKLEGQVEILRGLNDRLEWALDREHRLGHAYFMNVDSSKAFDEKFESQIVPLLIEYFPHDFQTLRAVLGEKENGFLVEMKKPDGFAGSGKKYRWWFESGVTGFSAFATLKANYGL